MLHEMSHSLEACQKALNEYLELKKNIFPRFYFVSNVALLDILANGNNPPRVMPHLADCFDAIANLQFVDPPQPADIDGEPQQPPPPNTATGMMARDGEEVVRVCVWKEGRKEGRKEEEQCI
jgi:dynein heavy chain, axonemal